MSDTLSPAEVSLFELANQFIEVANRLLEEDKDLGEVANAFRYAAARFTAHETTLRLADYFAANAQLPGLPSPDQAKQELVAKFTETFKDMLDDNLSEHIDALSQTQQ